jgi:hypothetical protein
MGKEIGEEGRFPSGEPSLANEIGGKSWSRGPHLIRAEEAFLPRPFHKFFQESLVGLVNSCPECPPGAHERGEAADRILTVLDGLRIDLEAFERVMKHCRLHPLLKPDHLFLPSVVFLTAQSDNVIYYN